MPSLPAGLSSPDDVIVAAAKTMRGRLAEALDPPFVLSDMELRMSASIGTALFPRDAVDARGLLRHADTTMYRSKRGREGDVSEDIVYVGTDSDDDDVLGELSLASRLRRAVREGTWQLAYQPIVELVLGRIVGAEALLRWPDDGAGEMSPVASSPWPRTRPHLRAGRMGDRGADRALPPVARRGRAGRHDRAFLQPLAPRAVAPPR